MKTSKCWHCQTETPDHSTDDCAVCGYHPWSGCDHPDCSKLPPVKHEPKPPPVQPPVRARSSPTD
ncbi:hypothetical protein GGS24DRAFT_504161 [Hypoxylon argillaceum]|nr:hypothetical protein GGS24DRAFT_504161 [Hypoxylon argillaceum]KAI1148876.1 hypothetical protein F4825DRAFT_454046 [Nemania diffusa]